MRHGARAVAWLWTGGGRAGNRERIQCRLRLAQISNLTLPTIRFVRSLRAEPPPAIGSMRRLHADSGFVRAVEVTLSALQHIAASEMWLTEMSAPMLMQFQCEGAITATRIPRQELLSIPSGGLKTAWGIPGQRPRHRQAIAAYSDLTVNTGPLLGPMGRHLLGPTHNRQLPLLLKTGPDQSELAQQRGYSAARRNSSRMTLSRNLSDPRLTMRLVAMRQGAIRNRFRDCLRYGFHVHGVRLEQRLQKRDGYYHLQSAVQRKSARSPTTLAFSDLAYFNRTFRSRFGMTPSTAASIARSPDTSTTATIFEWSRARGWARTPIRFS